MNKEELKQRAAEYLESEIGQYALADMNRAEEIMIKDKSFVLEMSLNAARHRGSGINPSHHSKTYSAIKCLLGIESQSWKWHLYKGIGDRP